MNKNRILIKWLNVFVGLGVIIAACIGLFYSTGGEGFQVKSIYGNSIELYGDGIYAFNSTLTVANRLGADVAGIIMAIALIITCLWKKRTLWIEIAKTSAEVYITYHLACLVFGVSMNFLYFLYVICFSVSLFCTIASIRNLLHSIKIPKSLGDKKISGTGIFLITVGMFTALLWSTMIIPAILSNQYGALLGIQTTEVTYGIDLAITSPTFIICGFWLLRKKEIGYKIAPILLGMMVGIAVLVISQRMFCAKLGIEIPFGALMGFIVSFVLIGLISLYLAIKLIKKLSEEIV